MLAKVPFALSCHIETNIKFQLPCLVEFLVVRQVFVKSFFGSPSLKISELHMNRKATTVLNLVINTRSKPFEHIIIVMQILSTTTWASILMQMHEVVERRSFQMFGCFTVIKLADLNVSDGLLRPYSF